MVAVSQRVLLGGEGEALALPQGSWDGGGGQLLLGIAGWHIPSRLQGLGRHLYSIFLVWLSPVLVVQSLTP